jgi:hypothetical protein
LPGLTFGKSALRHDRVLEPGAIDHGDLLKSLK